MQVESLEGAVAAPGGGGAGRVTEAAADHNAAAANSSSMANASDSRASHTFGALRRAQGRRRAAASGAPSVFSEASELERIARWNASLHKNPSAPIQKWQEDLMASNWEADGFLLNEDSNVVHLLLATEEGYRTGCGTLCTHWTFQWSLTPRPPAYACGRWGCFGRMAAADAT